MSGKRLRDRILRRARHVGLELDRHELDGLEHYYRELGRWSLKINLTAFQLTDDGTDDSVDRLLIEPLIAAKHIPPGADSLVDIGSGGGSPAIPVKLARPELSLTMVEVKVRKSAFLRQVARQLKLERTVVETSRFEELLSRPELHEAADVVTVRAVRLDASTLSGLQAFLKPGGQLLSLTSTNTPETPPLPLRVHAVHSLIPENQSWLVVMQKQRVGQRST